MKNSIVFISNAFGGIKTFQDTLIKFITKMEIECVLIDGKRLKKNNKEKLKHHKINVLKKIYGTFKILQKIKKLNKKRNTIFIFSNPVILMIYFLYIKIFFHRKKIFLFAHSHLTKKNILLYLCSLLSSIFSIFISKIFYVSKFTKKYWENIYFFPKFSKNSVEYNSIKISKKINKIVDKKFRIGFVGRIDKEKGLKKFLQIAYENKNNFVFNIFSNSRLRLNNNQKKYVNFFYNKDISKIYKNMDILLVTSPIENCPFSILEAKSYGIPTLVYLTKGGVSEIVKNNYNGLVITSIKNNLKIIDYINRIKVNYKFFSNNAYVDAKKYNAESKIPKLIKNELLK
jgi:amylovoran biosynthesis glycosyltransferase AmsD